jgi:hypothetical protein
MVSKPGDLNPRVAATAAQNAAEALIPTTIDDLADVDTSTAPPTSGQVLGWDSVGGLWKPTVALKWHVWGDPQDPVPTSGDYWEISIDQGLLFTATNGNFIEFEAAGTNELGFWAAYPDWSLYWGIGALKPSGRRTIEGDVSFEFQQQPYYLTDKIYHEGNLSFGTGLSYNALTGVLDHVGRRRRRDCDRRPDRRRHFDGRRRRTGKCSRGTTPPACGSRERSPPATRTSRRRTR